MGAPHELLIADTREVKAVLDTDDPIDAWEGFPCRDLDSAKLVSLWALVEGGDLRHEIARRRDDVPAIPDPYGHPWVAVVPPPMLESLAAIAAMDDDEVERLAGEWGRGEEFEGWDRQEIFDLLRDVGDLAETALLERKTLLLWTGAE
jgi:hypothetical protein